MFGRIRSALGGTNETAVASVTRLRGTYPTDSGMHGLWRPSAFAAVHDYDSWERELFEDEDIARHIAAGALVPINIGSDGVFEIEVRFGTAAAPAQLSEREAAYLTFSSDPYRFVSDGEMCVSGVEYVTFVPDAYVGRLPLPAGEYSVVVHLIAWDQEPGMVGADGSPSADALPDYVVLIGAPDGDSRYRTDLRTFT